MLFWVFDLDYTLYNLPKSIQFDYDLLKEDYYIDNKCPYGDGYTSNKIYKILNNEK